MKRISVYILSLFIVSILIYSIALFSPSSLHQKLAHHNNDNLHEILSEEQIIQLYALDSNYVVQYFFYIKQQMKKIWQDVNMNKNNDLLQDCLNTLWLIVISTILAFFFGIFLGLFAIKERDILKEYCFIFIISCCFLPIFLLLFLISYIDMEMQSVDISFIMHSRWLPVIMLSLLPMMLIGYSIRISLIKEKKKSYYYLLRSQYISFLRIYFFYLIPNIFEDILLIFRSHLNKIITSVIVIEYVFSLRGVGANLIHGLMHKDIIELQTNLFCFAIIHLSVYYSLYFFKYFFSTE